jgi:pyruvate,orthophosphate dikinase
MSDKHIFFIHKKSITPDGVNFSSVGNKAYNLIRMSYTGLPVPPAVILDTNFCDEFFKNGEQIEENFKELLLSNIRHIENATGLTFGGTRKPLLISIRSGGPVSMPGMLETLLNIGLCEKTIHGMIRMTGNPKMVWDLYRRLIANFAEIVFDCQKKSFDNITKDFLKKNMIDSEYLLNTNALKDMCYEYLGYFKELTGQFFPEDPYQQLEMSVIAVFKSWNSKKAKEYRKIHNIKDQPGTAVILQKMVFGNMGDDSGTGVAFTRNPATGEKKLFGEFLMNAQGEDVVAGIRTPKQIDELKNILPDVFKQLQNVCLKLENHYKDMQDVEFTVERGKLYMLQTRTGKRTAFASVKIANAMVKEGLIDKETAILRITPDQVDQLLHPMIDPKEKVDVVAKGLPASPGAAVGKVVFYAKDAEIWAEKGEKVILVRAETSPEDIGGMHVAAGILTGTGGMTSHAAVVARGMGKCCIVGCSGIKINEKGKFFTVGEKTVREGDVITINGSTGEVILKAVKLVAPKFSEEFREILSWADDVRKIGIRANADTPKDAQIAREFGAEGIGLCRTEHMFFEGNRIDAVREMILSSSVDDRKKAINKIKPYQKDDFKGIFKAMEGLPVTVRLLDPPLHEFIPHTDEDIMKVSKISGVNPDVLKAKVEELKEFNPMLGHRGCRLGVTYPEIYEMQARAILEATCECIKEGISVKPEIMIPVVADYKEVQILREMIDKVAIEIMNTYNIKFSYMVGTMLELPRACITADEVASYADFFSFGTNDLTQTTLGISRDDAGRFLPTYVQKGIYKDDPFITIDQKGVGFLIKMGVEKGRSKNPILKTGICGEHGGDPESINFCYLNKLNYVSCSPFRVPVARISAAHATLLNK